MRAISLIVCVLQIYSTIYAQTNPSDSTFAHNGINILQIAGNNTAQIKTAYQSDSKIVVCTSKEISVNRFDFCVIRFNENGRVDSTFGTNGIVLYDFLSPEDQAKDIFVQTDDKILVVGTKGSTSDLDFVVLRLNSDGTTDEGFGENGIVSFNIQFDDSFFAVCQQQDGKILAAGQGENCGYIFRLLSNGQLDTGFGNNGKVKLDFGNYARVTDIISYENSQIIAVGMIAGMASSNAFVVNLNTDGSFNQTFGTGGKYLLNSPNQERINCVVSQPDGKIIVGGAYAVTAPTILYNFYLLRLLPSGVLDPSFNNTGTFMTPIGLNPLNECNSISLNSASEILAIGSTSDLGYTSSDLAIIKVTQEGLPDSTFGTNGIYISDFEGNYEFGKSSFCKPDNKLVVSGSSGDNIYPMICRFNTSNITAVKKIEIQKLTVYPNPCTNSITIESSNFLTTKKSILTIMDINGQKIINMPLTRFDDTPFNINTDFLKQGVYILRLSSEDDNAFAKFVKL